ncbi:MAG: LolA family protein [Paracoccaceae bacterium]
MKWLLAAFLAFLSAAFPAAAAPDAAEVAQIEGYLNGITTLQARFTQIASDGGAAAGQIHIHRPGRLRIDYDPPTPIQLVADGRELVFLDKELDQITIFGLDATPVGYLLRPRIAFGAELEVTALLREGGTLRLQVVDRKKPGEGSLELRFDTEPLALRQWTVTDAQGRQTAVTLHEVRLNAQLDARLFQFDRLKYFMKN